MRRCLVLAALALSVSAVGCKSVSNPDKQRRAEERREKANEQMMNSVPNGEASPFGS
jgi:uncharacterized lipoprotein